MYSEEAVVHIVKRLLCSEEAVPSVIIVHCLWFITSIVYTFKLAHPYTQNRCTHAHTIDVPTHNNYFHGY